MRGRGRWLCSWWFLASVGVLALNDHVLKSAQPGWWTGKVSDLVGPMVVATLLAIVLGRGPAVALTAIGFAAMKVVPGVAEVVAPVLGGVTRRDPTDLVGLVGLLPAWILMGRPTRTRADSSPRPMAMVAAATALVVATATAVETPEVTTLVVVDDQILAHVSEDYETDAAWAASDDGGESWTLVDAPESFRRTDTSQACRADGSCFRAVGDAIEERAPGGEWRTSYTLSQDRVKQIAYESMGTAPDPGDRFDGVVVVGDTVIADASDQGVVVLSDGEWREVAVLQAAPFGLRGPRWAPEAALFVVVPVSGLIAFILLGALWRRGFPEGEAPPRSLGNARGVVVVAMGIGWGVVLVSVFYGTPAPRLLAVAGFVAAAITLTPLLALTMYRQRSARGSRPVPPPPILPGDTG